MPSSPKPPKPRSDALFSAARNALQRKPVKSNPGSVNGIPMSSYNDIVDAKYRAKAYGANPGSINGMPSSTYNELVDRGVNTSGSIGKPAAPANSSPVGSSVPGVNLGGSVPEAPVVDPNAEFRAQLASQIGGLRDQTLPLYDQSQEDIRKIYAGTSGDLKNSYDEGLNPLRAGANSLGFGGYFSDDPNVRMFDAAAKKLQETSDLNLANDLSWTEKMQGARGDMFNQLLQQVAMGLFDPEAVDAGGGGGSGGGGYGGGRRSGGSGGGSDPSDITETATLTELFYNPGVADAIAGVVSGKDRAYLDSIYAGTGTNPQNALKESIKKYNEASARSTHSNIKKRGAGNPSNILRTVSKKSMQAQRAEQMRAAQKAVDFFKQFSAGYSPQKTKAEVKTSGKKKS
jgi:hypothetical protein